MKRLILDGEKIKDRQMLHDIFAEELELPDWYGKNLDALHDCLSEVQEETKILLVNKGLLQDHLGQYARALEKMLQYTAKENTRVLLEILE